MQRGFSSVLLIFVVLLVAAAGFGGYYFYNQQKLSSINSFEECAKYFPVMVSYPGQCNTPDGKHFVQEVSSNQEQSYKQNVSSISASLSKDWKVYTNVKFYFSVQYPADWQLVEPTEYYSDINIYPPSVDLNNLGSDTPVMGIRIAEERPFADSPKGNITENGIPMVTDWKQIEVHGLKGVYYQTHQCAPQCLRFADFPYNDGKGTISIFISTQAREAGYMQLFEKMYQTYQKFPTDLDERVWNDVHAMIVSINIFYVNHKRLPRDFNEVLAEPGNEYLKKGLKNNPINNEPYIYAPAQDGKSFQVSGMQSNGVLYIQTIPKD